MKFRYTGVEVTDLERALRFYREGLGMEVVGRDRVASTGGETATLRTPGGHPLLGLNRYPSS